MTNADLVLAVDCSTTACKAIAFRVDGRPVAAASSAIDIEHRPPLGWEQDAGGWWRALCIASRSVLEQVGPERIASVCITHQRETFVVCHRSGEPLVPAIVWMDERAAAQVETYRSRAGALHQLTGKPLCLTPSYYKALWLREQSPSTLAGDVILTDVHGFLARHLTGRWTTSLASADPTGMVDMTGRCWSKELLGDLGLSTAQVPELVDVGALVGSVSQPGSRQTGLTEGTPVFAGAGDGQCAGLGAGILGMDTAYLNLGTAVVSGVCSPTYQVSEAYRTLFAAVPGEFQLETDLKGGTFTLNWLASSILGAQSPTDCLASLQEQAAAINAGADGLFCVPYFCGVMNPYWDDGAGGVFWGLRGGHGPAHMYRAIVEGICLEQCLHSDAVAQATGTAITRYITMGGGSRSDLFCQVVADATGRTVERAGTSEATSLGAAILGAVGAGFYPNVTAAVAAMTSPGDQFTPGPDREVYARLLGVYKEIYPALASIGVTAPG